MSDQISAEQLKKLFPNASNATLQRNRPNGSLIGGLQNPQRKQASEETLDSHPPLKPIRKRRVAVSVEIISLRHRLLDDDNLVAGTKSLRDNIATSLGVDDADKRVRWHVGQCQTSGREQTIVKIGPA